MLFSSITYVLLIAAGAWSVSGASSSSNNNKTIVLFQKPYPSSCSQVRTRKEVRDLTPEEWTRFSNAILNVTSDPNNNLLKQMGDLHGRLDQEIHFTPQFLPFHRYFLYQFEAHLLEVDPDVIIPYWDSSLDANDPAGSVVLSESYYGSSGPGTCIKDGPFANLMIDQNNCVQRNYNQSKATFASSSLIGKYIRDHKDDSFALMTNWIEVTPHPFPHLFIGGSMSTMKSPYDPLFFAHHAFIDKLWDDWQLQNAGENKQKMDGGVPSSVSAFGVESSSVWTVDHLCYQYVQSSAYSKNATNDYNNNSTTGVPTWNTTVPQLPDDWIKMNGGNVSKVRSIENKTQQTNTQVIKKGETGNPPSGPGVEIRKQPTPDALSSRAVIKSSNLALFGLLSAVLFLLL